jgi:hypothetical protein
MFAPDTEIVPFQRHYYFPTTPAIDLSILLAIATQVPLTAKPNNIVR